MNYSLLCFLDTSHDGWLAIVGTLDDAGQDPGDPGVLGLLQTSHHPLLHHTHKLLVAQLAVTFPALSTKVKLNSILKKK